MKRIEDGREMNPAGSSLRESLLDFLRIVTVLSTAAAGFLPGAEMPEAAPLPRPAPEQGKEAKEEIYTCPMHPSVRNIGPGRCPICGMTLTPVGMSDDMMGKENRAVFHVSPGKQQAIGVRVETAAVRELTRSVRAVGSVSYNERKLAIVNLRFPGWIDSVFADYNGRFVRRGDPLLSIYSPEAVAAQNEHLLSRAYASDTAWTVDGILGESGLKSATRDRLLYLGFSAEQIGALENAGKVSRTVVIPSPLTGTIVEKTATAGMYAEPGTTLYTIADLSVVWLNAEIYQSEIPDVHNGQEAEVRFGQYPGRRFAGKVTFINPVLDPTTRSAKARIEIPNSDGALKPGMYGNIVLRTGGKKRLSVPVSAVLNTGTREIVFVSGGGDLIEARIVATGYRNDEWCEVLSGVREGEKVISSATFLIDAESRIQGVLDRMAAPEHAGHGGHK